METLYQTFSGWKVGQVAPSIYSVICPDGTLWASFCYLGMAINVCNREA